MKMNKSYFLVVLFLCGLSVENVFAAAPSTWALLPRAGAGAAAATAPVAGHLGDELINAARGGKERKVENSGAASASAVSARCRWIARGSKHNLVAVLGDAISWGREHEVDAVLKADNMDASVVNDIEMYNYTLLTMAIGTIARSESIIEKLLQVDGIDVNAADRDGWTALMEAATRGYESTLERLLKVDRIEVNAADRGGNTALIRAATRGNGRRGNRNMVEKLLQADGIDVSFKNKYGKTAYDLTGSSEIKNILKKARLLQVERELEKAQPKLSADTIRDMMGRVQAAEFPE